MVTALAIAVLAPLLMGAPDAPPEMSVVNSVLVAVPPMADTTYSTA